jgi:triphosphatase
MATEEARATEAPALLAQYSNRIFRDLHQTVLKYEKSVREGDVEGIHDMRVTIRRLRVAMSNFAVCIPREERRAFRSKLEGLADALGGVRDLDVMISRLGRLLSRREDPERRTLAPLARRLKARRRSRMRRLRAYLDGDEFAAFKREFTVDRELSIQESGNGKAA